MRVYVACLGLLAVGLVGCGDKTEPKVGKSQPALTKLIIEDPVVGKGPAVGIDDHVWVKYVGKLHNGFVFDTNTTEGKKDMHVQVGKGQVIKGWDQGLIGMKAGGKRKLSIPYALAYGDSSNGPIPAKTDLYFDIELVRILKESDFQEIKVTILKEGTGRPSKAGDTVTVDYVGKDMHGKDVSSSKDFGQAVFTLGKRELVSTGLEQGILGMKVGEKRSITIPPGFGMPSSGEPSLQMFEVTLKSIK